MRARSMLRNLALLVAVVFVAASCAVPDPPPVATVPANWGSGLSPSLSDVAYSSAWAGCGHGANDHSRCGGSTTLDIYHRTLGASRGTIVFVHGGGSFAGDKSDRHEFGPILRETHRGWDVVSVNYRLVNPANGANSFPGTMNDVSDAIAWVRSWGPSHGMNVSRIVTAGHSAGGTLAALAGVAANGRSPFHGLKRVDGYITIGSVMNYGVGPNSRFAGVRLMLAGFDRNWQAASPITYLDANDPPGYLIHGDRDDVVELANAHQFFDKANKGGFGANVRLEVVDRYSDGKPMPSAFRGHGPIAGSNAAEMDRWLDRL